MNPFPKKEGYWRDPSDGKPKYFYKGNPEGFKDTFSSSSESKKSGSTGAGSVIGFVIVFAIIGLAIDGKLSSKPVKMIEAIIVVIVFWKIFRVVFGKK